VENASASRRIIFAIGLLRFFAFSLKKMWKKRLLLNATKLSFRKITEIQLDYTIRFSEKYRYMRNISQITAFIILP
jgi:hypothetical protein